MIGIEHSLDIERPVDEVFAFVTNVENAPRWQAWAEEAKITPGGPNSCRTSWSDRCGRGTSARVTT